MRKIGRMAMILYTHEVEITYVVARRGRCSSGGKRQLVSDCCAGLLLFVIGLWRGGGRWARGGKSC